MKKLDEDKKGVYYFVPKKLERIFDQFIKDVDKTELPFEVTVQPMKPVKVKKVKR